MRKRGDSKGAQVVGLYCSVCGLPQRDTPSGLVCPNGHTPGGFVRREHPHGHSVTAEEAAVIRAKDLGRDVKPEDIVRASGALQRAMVEETEKEANRAAKNPTNWGSANRAQEGDPSSGFQQIVETVFVNDPKALYDHLEKQLVVGDKRTDHGTVAQHLDEAELNARNAHRLWQSAIVERKRWELDNEVVFSAMRGEATRALQHEKEAGTRAKQITDADVEARIATIYPEEYKAQEIRRVKMKAMVDSMGNLADVWMSRCKSLNALLSKQR
jgi:hypothetical protein